MNLIKLPLFHLYLLQLENFDLIRLWRIMFTRGLLWYTKPRKSIMWTIKLRFVFTLSLVLHLLLTIIAITMSYLTGAIVLVSGFFMYPLFFTVVTVLVLPIDSLIKQIIIQIAAFKMRRLSNVKIIGIAGSYGKTTTKELVASVLSQKYRVLKTPENINTPLGISRLILKNFTPAIEIFVVEMGEFYRGDIKAICDIVKPDIAVVTGINEAHLERLKNLDQTISTIFEVVTNSQKDASVVLNADDKNITQSFSRYCTKRVVHPYSSHTTKGKFAITNVTFRPDGGGQSFTLTKNKDSQRISTQLLGHYAIGSCICAATVGELLDINLTDITRGIAQVSPVSHRLQPIHNPHGILIIDDSYNGSSAGVKEAIGVLSQFGDRRKVFVTPGLVETGTLAHEVHRTIGNKLAPVANLVLLIKNSVTDSIVAGLKDGNFPPENIVLFSDATTAYSQLRQYLKPGDVVLLQNDWPENYI